MGVYSNLYENAIKSVNGTKKMIMALVVMWIKAVHAKPITIGNMVYWITTLDGEDVPAYCYLSDFQKGGGFLPIYDEYNTGEFGWSDFSECCRIFDVIYNAIQKS